MRLKNYYNAMKQPFSQIWLWLGRSDWGRTDRNSPNQLNSIEPNRTKFVKLCSNGLGSRAKSNAIAQSNMDCVQLLCDFENTKNTCYCYTEVTRASKKLVFDFQLQFYKKSRVQKSEARFSKCLIVFMWLRFDSIAELSRTQSMNWVRFCSIEIQFD